MERGPAQVGKDRWVVPLSLLAAGCFGYAYGDPGSNQNIYLLPGLKLAHHGFLQYDWWLNETTHYHLLFTWLVALLEKAGVLAHALALLNLALIAGAAYCVHKIASLLTEAPLAPWVLTLLAFFVIAKTESVGMSNLFTAALQPSTLGGAFLIFGTFHFAKRNHLASGLLIAISGAFHANYLYLSVAVFAGAMFLCGRKVTAKDFLKQNLPVFFVFAVQCLLIIDIFGASIDPATRNAANDLFLNFSVPFHYRPDLWLREFLEIAGYTVIGYFSFGRRLDGNDGKKRLRAVFLCAAALTWLGFVGAGLLKSGFLSRMFFFRITPFVALMALISLYTEALEEKPAGEGFSAKEFFAPCLALALLGSCLLLKTDDPGRLRLLLPSTAIILILLRETRLTHSKILPFLAFTPALVVGIYFNGPINFEKYRAVPPSEQLLYEWTKGTAPDSLFMIPPTLNTFRLFGERAVIVDMQAMPFKPLEIIEWGRRLAAVTDSDLNAQAEKSISDYREMLSGARKAGANRQPSGERMLFSVIWNGLESAYGGVPLTKKLETAKKFGAEYIVIRGKIVSSRYNDRIVYSDNFFTVFKV